MSAQWPTSWQGQTYLDCDESGKVLAVVSTPSKPAAAHKKDFQTIASRWPSIWPDFQTTITALMARYKQEPADWRNIRTLYVELSDELLKEDGEWSIGIVFSAAETMWVLPYRGLSPLPGKAHAIW